MRIDDEARNLIRLVGNGRLIQKGREREIG